MAGDDIGLQSSCVSFRTGLDMINRYILFDDLEG